MSCMREHINGLDLLNFILILSQKVKVAGESFGITGNVDHSLGRKLYKRIQKLL